MKRSLLIGTSATFFSAEPLFLQWNERLFSIQFVFSLSNRHFQPLFGAKYSSTEIQISSRVSPAGPQHCQRHQGPQSEPSMSRCCKYFCHLSLLANVKGRGSHILCGYLPTMVQKSLVAQPSVLTSRCVPLHPSFLRKKEVTGEGRNQRSFKMLSEDFWYTSPKQISHCTPNLPLSDLPHPPKEKMTQPETETSFRKKRSIWCLFYKL